MISEKKFKLETTNRDNIIKQLRIDRNKMIISYQKLNSDFLKIFETIKVFSENSKNTELNEELKKIKESFKKYF